MLKKIFSAIFLTVMILFAANNPVSAEKNVAIILDAPTGMFSDPDKVYDAVQTSLTNILGSTGYNILPIDETASYLQIYREENNLTDAVTTEGVAVESFLKKNDIDKLCQHFGSDYVIYTRVSSTAPTFSAGLFSASQKVNVIMDFRVWSNAKKDFSYMKRTTTKGTSTAIYAGIGSSSRALDKGLKKGLEEIEKDKVKIITAMSE